MAKKSSKEQDLEDYRNDPGKLIEVRCKSCGHVFRRSEYSFDVSRSWMCPLCGKTCGVKVREL